MIRCVVHIPLVVRSVNDEYQVRLYAEFEPTRLFDFLRSSNYYNLEKAYKVCSKNDALVPETVFLLGQMGNNKEALNLIIEKLGDVNRVGGLGSLGVVYT